MDGAASWHNKSGLTAEQLQRIEANRKKALEKLKQRQISNLAGQTEPSTSADGDSTYKLKKIAPNKECSPAQRQIIEKKKAEALEKLKRKHVNKHIKSPSVTLTQEGLPNRFVNSVDSKASKSNGWNERFAYQTPKKAGSDTSNAINFSCDSKQNSVVAKINKESIEKARIYNSPDKAKDLFHNRIASPLIGPPFEISFVLLNARRFNAKCKFDASAIAIFKTMKTKEYDMKTKSWSFALSEHDELIAKLRSCNQHWKIHDINARVINALKELDGKSKRENELIDLSRIDDAVLSVLFPFQKQGVSYGVRNNGRILIADDMGLGKTIQAISLALYYRSDWPVLVVTPSSVKVSWAKEFLRWIPTLNENLVNVVHTGKDDPSSGLINILSYDLLTKHVDTLKRKHFKIVIADESHFIKNAKAARTKAALELLKTATRVILLSGTPALSRPIELYTQIVAVNPNLFPSVHMYAQRYCDAKKNRFGWDYTGSSNLEELRIVLESKIMIRRMKNDVLDQLPDKQRRIVILDPKNVDTKSVSHEARKLERISGSEKRGALLTYFYASCEAKVKAVMEFISDMLEGGTKFILFGHHQMMLNAAAEMLDRKRISFIRIDGATPANARQNMVEQFQSDENCLVAILSITAANTGLNLTAASSVIFAELYWNPGALVQAEDRIYRIGQKNAVTITYLLAENTADDYIWPLVQSKLDILASAGLTQDEFSPEITKFEDPKQKQILDFFHELMDDEDALLASLLDEKNEVIEPLAKRAKTV